MRYELTEREKEIVSLRNKGMTLEAIASKYGITKARVGQIYQHGLRKLRINNKPTDLELLLMNYIDDKHLCTSVCNALFRNGVTTVERLMTLTDDEMFRFGNVGVKSVDIILTIQRKEKKCVNYAKQEE